MGVWAVAGAIVTLAIVAVVIVNGDKTAKIVTTSGNQFISAIKAATHPLQAK